MVVLEVLGSIRNGERIRFNVGSATRRWGNALIVNIGRQFNCLGCSIYHNELFLRNPGNFAIRQKKDKRKEEMDHSK